MPGGLGTLEELMEVLTWVQLGIHSKPVGVLNSDGFYDHWLAMVDNAVACGFLSAETAKGVCKCTVDFFHSILSPLSFYGLGFLLLIAVVSAATPQELLPLLQAHKPPHSEVVWKH